MAENPHFIARKFQEIQRQSARPFVCPVCAVAAFPSEIKLFEHVTAAHAADTPRSRESPAWKDFVAKAQITKAKQKNNRRLAPENVAAVSKRLSNDSMGPNLGDESVSRSRASSRPVSASVPSRTPEKSIDDMRKLSINQTQNLDPIGSSNPAENKKSPISIASNPLKRTVAETGQTEHSSRKAKALSGGFIPKDPDFDRKPPPNKRLFDPHTDRTSGPRKAGFGDAPIGPRRADPRPQPHRAKRDLLDSHDTKGFTRTHQHHPVVVDNSPGGHDVPSSDGASNQSQSRNDDDQESEYDQDPELLLQPETRPISHEQLVVEVKGIYAGLVMVEAKCIDVDEKQSIAAQERDPSKQTTLAPEQWQALIALHKTLLHEHHDFFLASQHPSASPALSRLAAKYSMPARMWRHGIHAFLEVLRHRLPDSLDHMLAFIYIAYSMMALLYETVPTFEDTWIECLGDLGRYRMAIEDDDIRDRETWSGVARFWYGKAADKSPNVGRLYHHLAILARPFTIQQLSLYTRSLTCIVPFESARGSIMTLFNPVLDSKQDSTRHKSSSMETTFLQAHGSLFASRSISDYEHFVEVLLGGMMIHYISRAGSRFKEVGVVAMLANSAALFEYGVLRSDGSSRSILRLAFEEVRSQVQGISKLDPSASSDTAPEANKFVEGLSAGEYEQSLAMINLAATLTFGSLSIALLKPDDKNVYPMVHTALVFIRGVVGVKKAIKHLERWVPWSDIAFFLTSIATPEAITSKVLGTTFPKPQDGIGRPLPEDFVMRGQLWSEFYLPKTWFQEAAVDDEERVLELPSMEAPRVERMLWLGLTLAAYNRWISYDVDSRVFSVTQYVKDLPTQEIKRSFHIPSDQDSIMTYDDSEDCLSDRSPVHRAPSVESSRSDLQPPPVQDSESPRKPAFTRTPTILQRKVIKDEFVEVLPKDDIEMTDAVIKHEYSSPSPKQIKVESEEWFKKESYEHRLSPQKFGSDHYASDPRKLEVINVRNSSELHDGSQQ